MTRLAVIWLSIETVSMVTRFHTYWAAFGRPADSVTANWSRARWAGSRPSVSWSVNRSSNLYVYSERFVMVQ